MDFYGFDCVKVVVNCDSLNLGLVCDIDSVCVWNWLCLEYIVELLYGVVVDVCQDVCNLVVQISCGSWWIYMQVLVQGKVNQLVSNVWEVVVSVGGCDYCLQLNEGIKLQFECIIQLV